MDSRTLALVIAAVSGITMAIQGSINAALSKTTGLLEATFIVHAVGLALASVLLFPLKLGDGDILRATGAPWYTWLGGALGVAIIYGVARSIPKVGAQAATTAIIASQVLTAALVDAFGLFGLDRIPWNWTKTIGAVMLAVGSWVILKR